jgi:PAS domain S-box-containing protein
MSHLTKSDGLLATPAHQSDAFAWQALRTSAGRTAEVRSSAIAAIAADERRWSVTLVTIGACLVLSYQLTYTLLALSFTSPSRLVIELHLFNVGCACAVLACLVSGRDWLLRRWPAIAFAMCAGVTIGSTAITTHSGEVIELYGELLVFVVGTGALLPWGPKWQLSFGLIILIEGLVALALPTSFAAAMQFLVLLSALAVGQCAAELGTRYRHGQRQQILTLHASEERLREEIGEHERTTQRLRDHEVLLYKIFDATKERCFITRLRDDRIVEVNNEFSVDGYSREELLDAPLTASLWRNPQQRQAYLEQARSAGVVQNLEADFRRKDGSFSTHLISGALIELNGEPCVVSTSRDITHLKGIERELIAAREAALAASRAKSEFLASMSHEIRTPMNAVLGMAELLAESELDAEQRKFLDVMRNNGGALLALINDILDLAKIESGRGDVLRVVEN